MTRALLVGAVVVLGAAYLSRRVVDDPAAAAVAVARAQLDEDVALTPEVVAVRPHMFADSCLGVPRPGEVCAQAITPGYLVELRAMGRVFEYHVAGDRARFCPPCSARLTAAAS